MQVQCVDGLFMLQLINPPTWVDSEDVHWCSLQPEAPLKLIAEHDQLHSNGQCASSMRKLACACCMSNTVPQLRMLSTRLFMCCSRPLYDAIECS